VDAFAQAGGANIVRRDLARTDLPLIDEDWIEAAFTPEMERSVEQRKALTVSDTLIGELADSDLIVIATPMYNYGMPAALKAWVDQVVRVGKTFTFDLGRGDFPIEPVLTGKTMVLLTSCGEFGFEPGGIRADQDQLVPHLTTLSKYLGVEHVEHVGIEYQEFGDHRHQASKNKAHAAAGLLANRLAEGLKRQRHVNTHPESQLGILPFRGGCKLADR
jgi:FMN-dependent NADH-azoreductase